MSSESVSPDAERLAGLVGPLLHGQLHLVEQDLAELHRRGDVERLAGHGVDRFLDGVELGLHLDGQFRQDRQVEADAVVLQLG